MRKYIAMLILCLSLFLIASCSDNKLPTDGYLLDDYVEQNFTRILAYPNSLQDTRYALVHTESLPGIIIEYSLYFRGFKDENGHSHRGEVILLIKQKSPEDEQWQNMIYYTGYFEPLPINTITNFRLTAPDYYGHPTDYYEVFTPIVLEFTECLTGYQQSQYDGSLYINWNMPDDELVEMHNSTADMHKGRTATLEISESFDGPYSALTGLKDFTITWAPLKPEVEQCRDNPEWSEFFTWFDYRY